MPLPCFYFSTKEVMALEYSNYPLIGIVSIAGCIAICTILAVSNPIWFVTAMAILATRGA